MATTDLRPAIDQFYSYSLFIAIFLQAAMTHRFFQRATHRRSGRSCESGGRANGFANQPTSRSVDDGLQLLGAWIMAAVRCAPPDNKPTPEEIARCHPHMREELAALPDVRVIVALGRIAFDAVLRLLRERGVAPPRRPVFEHNGIYRFEGAPTVIASYHPSRQNTHTGRLTPAMLKQVFRDARRLS